MKQMKIHAAGGLHGEIAVPGDKSISHRAVMLGSLAEGTTEITHFLESADCLSTIACFRRMGIDIEKTKDKIIVRGKGLHGLHRPDGILNAGNSGTTTRLLSGILAGQSFESTLDGDESLRTRPMKRIMTPLRQMGADIESLRDNNCVPLTIRGTKLHGIHYDSPVASAQVKSCVLLAGLYADGVTELTEPSLSRNHSELMLSCFGAEVAGSNNTVRIHPDPTLHGCQVQVPGDISSAAYFLAAALLVPNSEILIRGCGINPTRDGILRVCRQMGADIETVREYSSGGEKMADLLVRTSHLKGITIGGDIIPTLIDELPVIAVIACHAEGMTVIKDAAELRVKESDRIAVMTENLKRMGADVSATPDGMIIRGSEGRRLHGARIDTCLDHRIAMSFTVAALCAEGETEIENADCVRISYPSFYEDLFSLTDRI